MPKYTYVVFTRPMPGQDSAYNEWYSKQHLTDVLAVEGFVAAQRFELVDVEGNAPDASPYMAIYEIDADDPRAILDRLVATANAGAMPISESLDAATARTILYRPITDRIEASPGG